VAVIYDAGGELMADQADVETALAAIIANALYPQGTAAACVLGFTCRIYRGLPNAPALDADLANGVMHVSVMAASTTVKNVTRYPRRWVAVAPVPATLTVTVSGETATFSGACYAGQLAGIEVNGALFPYAVQANDSPPTVASNLAALLSSTGILVDYAGCSLTVPGAARFHGRVVAGAGALQEIKRQVQDFKISLWCPDPSSRDEAASLLDQVLAEQKFLPLADGSSARIIYGGTETSDMGANATLYRRDISSSAEYPTTLSQMTPAMLFGTASLQEAGVLIENLQG
jgi:hypothetical protein